MKTVVITGSARGLGLEMAKVFRKNDVNVVISDLEIERLKIAKEELEKVDIKNVDKNAIYILVTKGNDIVKKIDVDEDMITMDASFVDDLEADSLDVVELLMSFEDEFKVSIPDEKLEELKTIPQIVKIIDEYAQK